MAVLKADFLQDGDGSAWFFVLCVLVILGI